MDQPVRLLTRINKKNLPVNEIINDNRTENILSKSENVIKHDFSKYMEIVDSNENWIANTHNGIIDNTAYAIFGIIGKQGVGKSFLGSKLINITDDSIFKLQNLTTRKSNEPETRSINMYISEERIIWLDTYPLCDSYSLHNSLEKIHLSSNSKRSYSTEAEEIDDFLDPEMRTTFKNLEVRDIRLITFLLSVCDTIIVISEDGTIDPVILKYLKVAELLKPTGNTHPPNSMGSPNDHCDHAPDSKSTLKSPNIVYVINKCDSTDLKASKINSLNNLFHTYLHNSTLRYLDLDNRYAGDTPLTNLFLLPHWSHKEILKPENVEQSELYPYHSHLTLLHSINRLKLSLIQLPKCAIFRETVLTERQWFEYAHRIWDALRQSALINEYHNVTF